MRVVSLVPSLTEAVALTVPGVLVGATDWCSHPVGLDVARVGGSKYPDLVVLPDEPYRFTADDGPDAFPGVPCALLSGRHLTWYGPSLAEAPALLADQLSRPVQVD
ncbi:helical backbone metal receptor [Micromonospora vinacea]|uniref:helical backbone metal receptor n=1 Tax=Micromonospora vinacea TaxID=709878 RepID=UPI00345257C7